MKSPSITLANETKRENFIPVTQWPITLHTLSVSKCIVNIVQWHFIELMKVVLMPLKVSNYYLIKAKVLDELFQKLNEKAIERYEKNGT